MRKGVTVAAILVFAGLNSAAFAAEADTTTTETTTTGPATTTTKVLGANEHIAILPMFLSPDKHRGSERNGFGISVIYGRRWLDTNFFTEANIFHNTLEHGSNQGTDFYQTGATFDIAYDLWGNRGNFTPFVLGGVGAIYDDVYPNNRDSVNFIANAGFGAVSGALLDNGLALRFDARYVYDNMESGYSDYRIGLGIEIPLGQTVEKIIKIPVEHVRVVQAAAPPPPRDSDGDGVPDDKDLCPNTLKGTRVDSHGCAIAGQSLPLKGVNFQFNKATLTLNAEHVLDYVVLAMQGQPTMHVEIDGYTDSVGAAAYNLKLSQRRADSVRDYLVKHGIDAGHVTTKGYGESRPLISPEKTAEDRAVNRRVEFKIVSP